MILAVATQLSPIKGHILSGRDGGGDDLAPFIVRQSNNRDVRDAGVFRQNVFNLFWTMALSAANEHFLYPVRYPDIAASVHDTKITGMETPSASMASWVVEW
jgi:hypothetical protein